MIFEQGRIPPNLTYSTESRQVGRNSNPAQKARIWPQMEFCNDLGNLTAIRDLAQRTIEGTEDPARLKKEFAHLMSQGFPQEVQLPYAYFALIAHLLELDPLPLKPEQRPNGAVDVSAHGLLLGQQIPEPLYLAELGAVWMILGVCQKNEQLLFAGLKVVHWQSHLLDTQLLPHFALWSFAPHFCQHRLYAMHYLLLMVAFRVTSEERFLHAAQAQKTKTAFVGKLLSLVPENLNPPVRLPYRPVTEEMTLGMVTFKAPEGSVMCGLSGRNSGLFSYHKSHVALVNAGPQMAPFDALNRFGIERQAGSFNDILWEKTAHHFRLKGWTKVFSLPAWLELSAEFQAHYISLVCRFESPPKELAFVFYATGDRILLAGKTSFVPGGLHRYQGKSLPVEIKGENETIFIEPDSTGEMQIIPLAGGAHFFGAQFLIAYSCGQEALGFQIK
jgi:hypothetical protein